MTKTYALKRLLEHGPMSTHEIVVCTGWQYQTVKRALERLKAHKLIRPVRTLGNHGRGHSYEAFTD